MAENSLKKEIIDQVNSTPVSELYKQLQEARRYIRWGQIAEKAIKDRIRPNLKPEEILDLGGGLGAKIQYKNFREIPVTKAQEVVQDLDQLNLILKIDIKKAEEVLDEETFKKLMRQAIIGKTTEALVFTGADEE